MSKKKQRGISCTPEDWAIITKLAADDDMSASAYLVHCGVTDFEEDYNVSIEQEPGISDEEERELFNLLKASATRLDELTSRITVAGTFRDVADLMLQEAEFFALKSDGLDRFDEAIRNSVGRRES